MWYLTTAWSPSAVAHRSTLEVRCRTCAHPAQRHPAPTEVVAWLALRHACCAGCGDRVEAPLGAGGER